MTGNQQNMLGSYCRMFALPESAQVGSRTGGWQNCELNSAQPSSLWTIQEQPGHLKGSQHATHKDHRAEQTGSGKLCVCPELRIRRQTFPLVAGWHMSPTATFSLCYLSPHAKPKSVIFHQPLGSAQILRVLNLTNSM